MTIKKARMLLRVSSNQQLEADGDLTIQRQLVKEYIDSQKNWYLDSKEYFEGSNSGYKNSVADRDVLQEALADAKKHEYDVLVAYKDDRIGRRMWEIGSYVMQLKSYGVDIYTVKDGCISPETDDIMGQMVLALRYGNAQKSSSDTGQRVKDTAQKLVQKGKFMGGKAPYGYELVYSGEISKHGRALKKPQIVEEQAAIVKYIYDLSINKEFGSVKIAKILNQKYPDMAPNDVWKSGTITSILTNPLYSGHVAYKRRERINGRYLRLDDTEWIKSEERNEEIAIVDEYTWNLAQRKRKMRSAKCKGNLENQDVTVIRKNDGELSLIDVAYCGYCGRKLTNGTKYNYWTVKSTNERKASKIATYRCQGAWEGVPHDGLAQFRAEDVEKEVYKQISGYLSELLKDISVAESMKDIKDSEKNSLRDRLDKYKGDLEKAKKALGVMEEHIPDAITGEYALPIEQLSNAIRKQEDKIKAICGEIKELEGQLNDNSVNEYMEYMKDNIPKWQSIFIKSEQESKRVIVNYLIKRIYIQKEEITIEYRFKKP